MAYVPLDTPLEVTGLTEDAAWHDIDLDSWIADLPSDVSGAAIMITNTSGTYSLSAGLRKNGSTDAFYGNISTPVQAHYLVGVDASKIFEYKLSSSGTTYHIYIVGYFTSGFVFNTNFESLAQNTIDTWTDTDGGHSTAVGYMVAFAGTLGEAIGLRCNGSTHAALGWQGYLRAMGGIVKAASGVFEQYIGADTIDVYEIGYITSSDVQLATNPSDISLSSTGSFYDLSASSAGAIADIIDVSYSGGSVTHSLRKNGASIDYYYNSGHCWQIVSLDVNYIAEGKISNATADFYRVGYFTAPSGCPKQYMHYNMMRARV